MPDIRNGEVVIEIDHPANSNVMFFPAMTVMKAGEEGLRSRLVSGRSGPGGPRPFATILSIPGQRIHVDVKAGVGRITDALGDKENAQLLDKVKKAAKDTQTVRNWNVSGPIPSVEVKLSPVDVHNWLFWMARIRDNGHGTVVAGQLQPAKEYRKAGDIKVVTTNPRWANREFEGGTLKPLEAAVAG